jgi:hypothetical protein
MSQTRLGSWVETITNTVVGFIINYVANLLILPFFVTGLTYSGAFWMGIIFTVISVVRSYLMRRGFNRIKASWTRTHPQEEV